MQKDEEPIEKFVKGLYELAENWDFPQKNDQIRTEKQGIFGKTPT